MLGTTRTVSVFAYPEAIDLRKGYDGLYGLEKVGLDRDPLGGDMYLFVNRRRDACKVLVWDGTGLCIFQKRLATGAWAFCVSVASKRGRCASPDDDGARLVYRRLRTYFQTRVVSGGRGVGANGEMRERDARGSTTARWNLECACVFHLNLRYENDIEQLRRIAVAQQVQIEQLLRVLRSQSDELGALKGNDQELQQKFALVEEMARRANEELAALEKKAGDKKLALLPADLLDSESD